MKPSSPVDSKASGALRTIGEVAEQLDVPQYVLRFWESKFSQVSPEKHRGRRYYRPEDIVILRQVKTLLYDDKYTIKGVQNFLKNKPLEQQNDRQLALFGEKENTARTESPTENPPNEEKLQGILDNLRASRNLLKTILGNQ